MQSGEVRPYFGVNNNINIPVTSNPIVSTRDMDYRSLAVPQKQDVYTSSVKPEPTPASQKIISDVQDKLFAKIFPEKYIQKYTNPEFLKKAVQNNPNIAKLLGQEGLNVRIEPQNINSIIKSHLIPTSQYARAIMENSGEYFTQNDYNLMLQAALIHDVGKALIPSEVLNKKGPLTPKEREIIKLHNDLGYELLRSSRLNPRILMLIQNHHGYGQQNFPKDSMSQILTVADIYSALKEPRPYKPAMSNEQAFKILEEGAARGDYSINYVNSLKRALAMKNYTQPKNDYVSAA